MKKLIYLVLVVAVMLAIFFSLSVIAASNKEESPKAIHVIPQGDSIENLQAHAQVALEPISRLKIFGDLPVWISHSSGDIKPSTYDGIFWEIEPMGEYLYYLAGDYRKNKKGLLRFPTAKISFRVEMSFEDDIVHGARAESKEELLLAKANGQLPKGAKLGEIFDSYKNHSTDIDWRVGFASLDDVVPEGASGKARVTFIKDPDSNVMTALFRYEEFRRPASESEYERYVVIMAEVSDPSVSIDHVVSHVKELVDRYHDMKYVAVSGAIRMLFN